MQFLFGGFGRDVVTAGAELDGYGAEDGFKLLEELEGVVRVFGRGGHGGFEMCEDVVRRSGVDGVVGVGVGRCGGVVGETNGVKE